MIMNLLTWLTGLFVRISNPTTLIQLYPLFFFAAILACILWGRFPRQRPYGRSLLLVAFCWCIFCYVAYPLHYFWLPNFLDQAESAILNTSRLLGEDALS